MLPIGRILNKRGLARPPSRAVAGFTLIELILLTVILAVLVAVSTPLFSRTFSSLRLREESYNLAKLINYVQEKSVLEGVVYKLVIDTQKERYYVMASDESESKRFSHLEEKAGRIFRLPEGVKIKTDKKEVLFYPDGHSDKASINIYDIKNRTFLRIKGNMGYVEFTEEEKE